MANNQSMLEQILSAAISGGGLRGAPSGGASSGSGGLGDALGGLLGGMASGGSMGNSSPGATGAGGLGDILGSILSAAAGNQPGTPSGVAPDASSQNSGMGDLARYGGLAVIGVLAYQALKKHQAKQEDTGSPAPDLAPPRASGFHPQDQEGGTEAISGTLLKAMIAAVQADGAIDEQEFGRLTGQLDKVGIGAGDRQALITLLRKRVDPAEVVDSATSPELALQIYAASALAVTIDTPQERNYLERLADAIGVDPELKKQVEATVGRT